MNLNTGEPRDGDFVAYIGRLELRQLHDMKAVHSLRFPVPGRQDQPTRSEAQTAQSHIDAQGKPAARYLGAIVLGSIGLLLALGGFFGRQGYLLGLLGLYVAWRAVRSFWRLRDDGIARLLAHRPSSAPTRHA